MIITPGEEGKAFERLEDLIGREVNRDGALDLLAALRERFEQLMNDRACATRSASEEMDERMRLDRKCAEQSKRIEQLEEQVSGLEEDLDEARGNLRRLCALAIGCSPDAVDLDPRPPKFKGDVDNACNEIDELRSFYQVWHEPLFDAGVEDPKELVRYYTSAAAEFLTELATQLDHDDPIHALKVHLSRHDPAIGGAIIPNAWHMTAQQLAYELANL